MRAIKQLILWMFCLPSSDSPPHVPPGELSTDTVVQVITNMTQTIRRNFPDLTVYPALGNHDYWPQVTSLLLGERREPLLLA